MSELKPGEYVGADGVTRAFCLAPSGEVVYRERISGKDAALPVPDLRAAAEALLALADEMETEYVELLENEYRLRLRGEDVELQYLSHQSGEWTRSQDTFIAAPAYRAGIKKGRES